jgi:PAS domain S-box-containing protein
LDEIPVVGVDVSGSIRYWSKGAERAFGHLETIAVGQSLDLIVPAEFRKPHWAGFRKALAASVADAEGMASQFPVLAANGEVIITSGTLSLLRGLDGGAIGAMVIFG